MKAGEKFIIKSGAKDEKNRMFINFPAFIRTRILTFQISKRK